MTKPNVWKPASDQDYVLEISSLFEVEDYLLDQDWAQQNRIHLCCADQGNPSFCPQVNPNYYPTPFDLVLKQPLKKRVTLTHLDVYGPQVLHREFAEHLRPHNTTAVFGDCYIRGPRGTLIDSEYCTVYDHVRNMVPVTSVKPNELTICKCCGNRAEWPGGNKYLWRDELGDRKWFLECVDLYITRWLNDRIPWDKFPDVEKYRVYIRDR